MDIVIIGTGNTASILGRKLKEAGHHILQIYGRDARSASDLAYELESESTNYWAVVNREADLYILAVSDIAIEEILEELQLPQKTVVHTAAAISKDILKKKFTHYGIFYPLQSLKKSNPYLPDIPIIIDASDEKTMREIAALAATISTRVVEADDGMRLKLHVAAVFCNNFVNHLYTLAEGFCEKEGLDFKLLIPLIKETALRLDAVPAHEAQTGPALRNDTITLEKHLKLLEKHPELLQFYELFTQSIGQMR